jgi:ubiquinone/menaquinone biosynthesis C-methylase UbiE
MTITEIHSIDAARSAAEHWNRTPLFLEESARYAEYTWLYENAEFSKHAGERVLEVGCGSGCDLLQFATNGAAATGVDITDKHLELAKRRVGNLAQILKADMRSLPF